MKPGQTTLMSAQSVNVPITRYSVTGSTTAQPRVKPQRLLLRRIMEPTQRCVSMTSYDFITCRYVVKLFTKWKMLDWAKY